MDLLLTNAPLLFGNMRNQDTNSSFIGVCEGKVSELQNFKQRTIKDFRHGYKVFSGGTREEHALMRMVNPRGSF